MYRTVIRSLINLAANKLLLILLLGLSFRFLLGLYAGDHAATYVKITLLEELFHGGVPILRATSFGTSFYIFYIPVYFVYDFLRVFLSIDIAFFLNFLFKLPPILGDLITVYALYHISLSFTTSKKARNIAAFYFLNPYVIWMSSIVGHAEQLMMAFLLLSILFLIRKKIILASGSLALLVSFRHFPILVIPVILIYIWKTVASSASQTIRFLTIFIGLVTILATPYLYSIFVIYQTSPDAAWAFFDHWLGIRGGVGNVLEYSIAEISLLEYNFTGVFASLGIWETIKGFFGLRAYLVYFTFITIFFLYFFKKGSINWINNYIIVIFSTFILIIPLAQHHYMMWVFPFMLLGAYIFRSIPKYFPLVLSFSVLGTDIFAGGSFVYWLDATFPKFFGLFPERLSNWLFFDYPFATSISIICAITLLLSIIFNLSFIRHQSHDKIPTEKNSRDVSHG